VGQSYLDLAATYLGYPPSATNPLAAGEAQSSQATPAKPMLLCYHGTDLERFQRFKTKHQEEGRAAASRSAVTTQSSSPNKPLKAVYLGAMGQGYDLMTILKVAARWNAEGQFPVQIHFAGTGTQLSKLKAEAGEHGLIQATNHQSSAINHQSSAINDSPRIVFHGLLNKDAVNELLLSSAIALVPNKPDSLVACPYKAGEYAAAGLPMLSCLTGELNQLLSEWNAGSKYTEGDTDSLHAAFEKYLTNRELLNLHSRNARQMAEALFDRNQTYAALTEFMLDSSQH
jgi:glycosyltransferase involved in cell wall biosynthesis